MPDPSAVVHIVIADDHTIFRDGLRRLLETEPGFAVVGEAATGSEAVRLTHELAPDVVLLDVAMPDLSGLDALPTIVSDGARAILLTAAIDPADMVRAVQAGARGVILKESATQLLIDGVRRVVAGQYVIGETVEDSASAAMSHVQANPAERYGLTPRELEVVGAIVRGASNRDIADAFAISVQTVKHHLSNIFDKTGTSSRLELALFALRRNLANPD